MNAMYFPESLSKRVAILLNRFIFSKPPSVITISALVFKIGFNFKPLLIG